MAAFEVTVLIPAGKEKFGMEKAPTTQVVVAYVLADDEQDAREKVEQQTGLKVVEVMRP